MFSPCAFQLAQLDTGGGRQGYLAIPAVADLLVELFWTLLLLPGPDTTSRRSAMLTHIVDALRQSSSRESTASKLVLRCVGALREAQDASGDLRTAAYLVLKSLVAVYPQPHESYNDWRASQQRTQVSVCTDLQRDYSIVALIVQETCYWYGESKEASKVCCLVANA